MIRIRLSEKRRREEGGGRREEGGGRREEGGRGGRREEGGGRREELREERGFPLFWY